MKLLTAVAASLVSLFIHVAITDDNISPFQLCHGKRGGKERNLCEI